MSEMGPGRTDAFSICQASNMFPIAFFITEARPTVGAALLDEVVHGPSDRGGKQQFSSNTVVKLDWCIRIVTVLDIFEESCACPVT